ncbi:MAG: DUF2905 domain-containing protein, partial [Balneolaceae bacterium]|nr:DUF2905 domain-containing protein [Balneolaceae bacterium]
MNSSTGKWMIGLGLIVVLAGMIIWLFGDRLGWLGNLPGDIHIENDNFGFYFPVTTMIIVSIALSILLTILSR